MTLDPNTQPGFARRPQDMPAAAHIQHVGQHGIDCYPPETATYPTPAEFVRTLRPSTPPYRAAEPTRLSTHYDDVDRDAEISRRLAEGQSAAEPQVATAEEAEVDRLRQAGRRALADIAVLARELTPPEPKPKSPASMEEPHLAAEETSGSTAQAAPVDSGPRRAHGSPRGQHAAPGTPIMGMFHIPPDLIGPVPPSAIAAGTAALVSERAKPRLPGYPLDSERPMGEYATACVRAATPFIQRDMLLRVADEKIWRNGYWVIGNVAVTAAALVWGAVRSAQQGNWATAALLLGALAVSATTSTYLSVSNRRQTRRALALLSRVAGRRVVGNG